MRKMIILFFTICNLHIFGNNENNILEKNCNNKNYQGCYDAIRNYRLNNSHTGTDWELVQKLYIDLCDSAFAEACMALGNLYTINSISEIKTDFEKSAKYNTKGCKLGNMIACNNLAVMYRYGQYYKKDYKKALELFTIACNKKDHSAVLKACSSKEKTHALISEM